MEFGAFPFEWGLKNDDTIILSMAIDTDHQGVLGMEQQRHLSHVKTRHDRERQLEAHFQRSGYYEPARGTFYI